MYELSSNVHMNFLQMYESNILTLNQITYHWFFIILCRLSNHMECFSEFLDFFIVSDQKTVMFLSISFLLLGQRLKWGHQRKGFVARATCTRNSNFIIGFFWTLLATLAAFPFVIWRYLRIGDVIGEFSIDSFNPLSFSTNHSSESIYCIRFDFIHRFSTISSHFSANYMFFPFFAFVPLPITNYVLHLFSTSKWPRLNLIFVEHIHVVGEKMAKKWSYNGHLGQSQILGISLSMHFMASIYK